MKKTLYVTSTLPRLTTTFIYTEIVRLRDLGMQVDTVSMNTPADNEISKSARTFRETTEYLDNQPVLRKLSGFLAISLRHPLRMLRCIGQIVSASPTKFPKDYYRLAYHLLEAAFLANERRTDRPEHIHSHFVNGPTSIAMFMSILLDVPYSFTMHASMIWLDPIAFKNKLETCAFCVSISEYNRQYVVDTYGAKYAEKINIIHCGIEPEVLSVSSQSRGEHQVFNILGVGQLNRRKGFHILMPALAKMRDKGTRFECTIIGEGEQRAVLESLISEYKIGQCVTLAGALLHEDVIDHLARADTFVLPCVISEDGWRDGIPVALMEAMYKQLPVVSSGILGMPELIDDGENGFLVPAGDSDALADALLKLAGDVELRHTLGSAGRTKVLRDFNNKASATKLQALIQGC